MAARKQLQEQYKIIKGKYSYFINYSKCTGKNQNFTELFSSVGGGGGGGGKNQEVAIANLKLFQTYDTFLYRSLQPSFEFITRLYIPENFQEQVEMELKHRQEIAKQLQTVKGKPNSVVVIHKTSYF